MSDDKAPIVAFIEARIEEDEMLAELADFRGRHGDVEETAAVWTYGAGPGLGDVKSTNGHGMVIDDIWPEFGLHIVRHHPQRAMADVAAKRRMLEWYQLPRNPAEDPQGWALAKATIKAVATIWCDHPHFREAWREE